MRTDGVRLALIAILISISALCYASVVDPSWIAGYYDDGDYDSVVILVTSMMGTTPSHVWVASESNHARNPDSRRHLST